MQLNQVLTIRLRVLLIQKEVKQAIEFPPGITRLRVLLIQKEVKLLYSEFLKGTV